MEIAIYNHQRFIEIPPSSLSSWQAKLDSIFPLIQEKALATEVLSQLNEIEISIVDDEKIAQIHLDFMDIPGATDVITFQHGEIIVSAQTAKNNAHQYEHNFNQEILLYMIHGILHLAGFDDIEEADRALMEHQQSELLKLTAIDK